LLVGVETISVVFVAAVAHVVLLLRCCCCCCCCCVHHSAVPLPLLSVHVPHPMTPSICLRFLLYSVSFFSEPRGGGRREKLLRLRVRKRDGLLRRLHPHPRGSLLVRASAQGYVGRGGSARCTGSCRGVLHGDLLHGCLRGTRSTGIESSVCRLQRCRRSVSFAAVVVVVVVVVVVGGGGVFVVAAAAAVVAGFSLLGLVVHRCFLPRSPCSSIDARCVPWRVVIAPASILCLCMKFLHHDHTQSCHWSI